MPLPYKYYVLSVALLLCGAVSKAQLGAPVYHQHFGEGNLNPATIGTPLKPGITSFTFSNETCPPPGSYTIVRRVNVNGCFNDEWIPLSRDHTEGMDFGNMMLVNYTTNITSKLVYVDTVTQPMCVGTKYEFSIALMNVDKQVTCSSGPTFPVFAMNVENLAGQALFTDTTHGGIPWVSGFMGYKFGTYRLQFIMPPGLNPLILRVVLLPSSADCGEDFAIDDIKLSPAGPKAQIGFDNEPSSTIVTSFCFQDNRTIYMHGSMDAFYSVPALQWQQSIDSGLTWTDIPGATTNNYTRSFSTPDTFLFRLSGAEAANIANPYCRVVSNIIKVDVDDIPKQTDAINNSPLCAGQTIIFNAEGGATYNWTGSNGFTESVPFPQIFNSSLADSGMYYVDITSLGGCTARDSTYVTMIGTDVHAGPDTAICKGNVVQLQASGGISYEWSPAVGLSSTTIARPRANPSVTTVYTVKVTDDSGCSDTAKAEVRVINKVEAKAMISAADYLCRSIDSVSFKDKSVGNIDSWHWDFGNGSQSTEANPPVQYYTIDAGTRNFITRLAIRDTSGCTDTAYHVVHVADNCYIAVPSAFTPNGDGKNDYLYPLNAYKATDLLFRVYNRRGQQVFETRDWTKKWDGKLGGLEQPADVYVWVLSYNDAARKKVFLKGTVLLVR